MFRAIIADDEYDIRAGLKKIIDWNEHGFIIVGEAGDGEEALELVVAEKPNLLITDIKMPVLDGLGLTRKVKELNPDIKIIIISGYDDFAYARDAIRYGVNSYLLKPVDPVELGAELNSVKTNLQNELNASYEERKKSEWIHDYFFCKLVKGESVQEDMSKSTRWHSLLQRHCFAVLLVELSDYGERLLELPENEIRLKKFAVRNILEEVLRDSGVGALFEISDGQFGALLAGDDIQLSERSVDKLCQRMVECVELYTKESIHIGVGRMVGRIDSIPQSFNNAREAFGLRLFGGDEHIYSGYEVDGSLDAWSLQWNPDGLCAAIKTLDRKKSVYELEGLLEELSRRAATHATVRLALLRVTVRLSDIVIEAGGDWKELYSNLFPDPEWISSTRSEVELRRKLAQLIEKVVLFLERTRNEPPEYDIERIVTYISNHYWEEINLKRLANLFYISSGYLGQLFKKETGQYFNDYMNRIRVDEAIKMLHDPRLSITEISEKVGYKNPNHLYMNFKNVTGMNPGDYRKQLQEKRNPNDETSE